MASLQQEQDEPQDEPQNDSQTKGIIILQFTLVFYVTRP